MPHSLLYMGYFTVNGSRSILCVEPCLFNVLVMFVVNIYILYFSKYISVIDVLCVSTFM